jgi:uncharacterized protein (UPF0333 family)
MAAILFVLVGLVVLAALVVGGFLLYQQITSKVDVAMVTDEASAQKVLGALAAAQISADVHRSDGGPTLAIRVKSRDEDRARSALRGHAIS